MSKDSLPWDTIDLDELVNSQPSNLPQNPTEAEELAYFFTPQQWPLRPPATRYPALPIKLRGKGEHGFPRCATMIYKDQKYLFIDMGVYEIDMQALATAPEVDPAELFEQGWVGD